MYSLLNGPVRILQVPMVDSPNLNVDLSNFLCNTSSTDLLHDVIIRVKTIGMPDVDIASHLFVLASRSSFLSRLIASKYDKKAKKVENTSILFVENVHLNIFEDCVEFLYSGQLPSPNVESPLFEVDLIDLGLPLFYWEGGKPFRPVATSPPRNKLKVKNKQCSRFSLLHQLLSALEVQNVVYPIFTESRTDSSDDETDKSNFIPHQHVGFSLSSLSYLCDCVVVCSNGAKFNAHKCMLAARVPYFSGMLFSPWINTKDEMPFLKVCFT